MTRKPKPLQRWCYSMTPSPFFLETLYWLIFLLFFLTVILLYTLSVFYPTAFYDGLPLRDTNYQENSLYLRTRYFPCLESSISSCSFWHALQWLLEMTPLLNLYYRLKTLPSLRLGLCCRYVVLLVSTTTSLWTGNITCDPGRQRRMEIMDIFRVEHIGPNIPWRFEAHVLWCLTTCKQSHTQVILSRTFYIPNLLPTLQYFKRWQYPFF